MRCTGLSLFCIVSCLRSSMKKILFIVNPVSGGKSKKPYLEAIDRFLDKEVYSYRTAFTEYSGHASELARDCEEDTVVAVGGDGTVSEVARGLIGTGPPSRYRQESTEGDRGPELAVCPYDGLRPGGRKTVLLYRRSRF